MPETPESLLNLVNASGFLFQLRIEEEIRRSLGGHYWNVVGHEHRWTDPLSDAPRFIDLILKGMHQLNNRCQMVVECKRVRDASWVFLIPDKSQTSCERARLPWTRRQNGQGNLHDWSEWTVVPGSPESSFCVVRGQDDMSMLERLGALLARSVESLASEELDLGPAPTEPELQVYLPVIITNATLQICWFDPNNISLDGELSSSQSKFEPVPFVRFRKSLSAMTLSRQSSQNLEQANREQEQTVFIINAEKMLETLKKISLMIRGPVAPWDAVETAE